MYAASEEVIKFVARMKGVDKGRQVRNAQGQEGCGSTSSASTQSCPQGPQEWTARSAYVATVNALDRSAMDAQLVQIQMAELVKMQKALLNGTKMGLIPNNKLVKDIRDTAALLEMTGRVVTKTTASICKWCGFVIS